MPNSENYGSIDVHETIQNQSIETQKKEMDSPGPSTVERSSPEYGTGERHHMELGQTGNVTDELSSPGRHLKNMNMSKLESTA